MRGAGVTTASSSPERSNSGRARNARATESRSRPTPGRSCRGSREEHEHEPLHTRWTTTAHDRPAGLTAGGRRSDRRHGARVVRLLHLRHGRRARVRRPVLRPRVGLGHADRVRDVRRRLRRAAVRRRAVRPPRRPDRPARDADHHDAGDGSLDRRDRPAADLRLHRHVGADPARRSARPPGPRRRRRVRRRVDAARRARAEGTARLLLLVRPDRRADRPRARHAELPARRAAARRPAHERGAGASRSCSASC